MKAVYLLLVLLSGGTEGGRYAVKPITFAHQEECEAAVAAIYSESEHRSSGRTFVTAVCLKMTGY